MQEKQLVYPITNHTEVNHSAIRSIAVAIEQHSMNIWPQWPQDGAAELWGLHHYLPTQQAPLSAVCVCVSYIVLAVSM